jgi:LmbE family N-acetylglucosaminyl deacetylase
MQRRQFLATAFPALAAAQAITDDTAQTAEVTVERARPGKPRAGSVIAAIQPHADDIPLFAAGTVLKLIDEGATGILIRMTNDDMAGPGSVGNTVFENEKDNQAVARALGVAKSFNLNYSNHQMDQESILEIRSRLIFIFRLMKVDTVVCYDPYGHYEENPDHTVTARAVETACWMAGGGKDYPEHFEAGLQPHGVREKYYFSRGPQLVNRVVDITPYIDRKVAVNRANRAQGPAGDRGADLRQRLATQGRKLPILGDDDETAANEYIKQLILQRDAEAGRKYGLKFAEPFHYIGPPEDAIGDYIKQHAVPIR